MKCHSVPFEAQFYEPSGAMPVLADVKVGEVRIVAVFVVFTLSIQHQHAVRVLLDRTRVA
jgi:hypothetical protein